MQLLIFNEYEELKTILSHNESVGNEDVCPFLDASHLEEINGENTFEFSLPGNHQKAEHVVKKNKAGFIDEDGNFQLFEITRVEEEHNDTQEKRVYARHVFYELKDAERIGDVRPTNVTALSALTSALDGTNWSIGSVADLGLNSTNFYRLNPLSAIHKVVDAWGGELRFRIVTVDNAVTGHFVDLLARRGAETGHAFEYGRNVESITKTEYITDTKTAMYGYGKGEKSGTGFTRRITFEDIVWTVAGGDPVDKPIGQGYVGDPDALANNGRVVNDQRVHRFGDFEDSEEEDKETLLEKTWNTLQKAKEIPSNYKMKAVDMEHLVNEFGESMDHTAVRLGDTNFAIDNDYNPVMQFTVRVIKVKNYLGEPERRELEHGNFLPLFTDDSEFELIKTKLNDQTGVWNDATTVTDGSFPDTTPQVPTNFTATGLFAKVALDWDYNPTSLIAAYELYASTISAFTPDSSNLVFRGKSGGFSFQGVVNMTYYFRLRAINPAGTASGYTAEVFASTVRINAGTEIVPLTITNELIAADANIDFAKIANVQITNAMVVSLNADKIVAGTIDVARLTIGTGVTFDAGFDPTTKETPTGAQTKATTAENNAIDAASSDATSKANAAETNANAYRDLWQYPATTFIDGGNIYTNTVTANAIAANSITTNELNVLAKGYVNNTTKTATVEGWSVGTGTLTANYGTRNAINVYAMRQYTSGDQISISDEFEVSALQMYKVTVSLYAGYTEGSRYLGLYAYDKDGVTLSVTPFVVSTRSFGTASANPYFWFAEGITGGWRDMVAYILPTGITENEIPEGKNVTNHYMLPENAVTVKIRVLNYYNAGVFTSAYWYGMEVTEADSGIINANQINVGTLTGVTLISQSGDDKIKIEGNLLESFDGAYRAAALGGRTLMFYNALTGNDPIGALAATRKASDPSIIGFSLTGSADFLTTGHSDGTVFTELDFSNRTGKGINTFHFFKDVFTNARKTNNAYSVAANYVSERLHGGRVTSTSGAWIVISLTLTMFNTVSGCIVSNRDGLATKYRNLTASSVEVCMGGTATGYVDFIVFGTYH